MQVNVLIEIQFKIKINKYLLYKIIINFDRIIIIKIIKTTTIKTTKDFRIIKIIKISNQIRIIKISNQIKIKEKIIKQISNKMDKLKLKFVKIVDLLVKDIQKDLNAQLFKEED